MKIKGKLHSASGSAPDMVEHVEVVVVDSDGALVLEVVVEVVVVVVVPVLVDAGGAETPEIRFLFRCQHLLNVTNYAIQV